jgi:hypothetical protein
MKEFIFHTDPGHGWLEVEEELVKLFNIRVSQFSYRKGNKLFLEEDCDAPRFTNALDKAGIEYKITQRNTNDYSRIRNYNRV